MIHEHRIGRETLLKGLWEAEPPTWSHAWSQLKVEFEKCLSLQSPHFTEEYTQAEKEQMTCLGSEAAAQSRRKTSILKMFVILVRQRFLKLDTKNMIHFLK